MKTGVLKYYELPRYVSKVGVAVANNATVRLESQSLQLNQIPDKLFIFVRKVLSSQKVQDADAFLPIKGISINWNNQAGILSSATAYDLYRYSREAGSNQSWNEFSGHALRNNPSGGSPIALPTTGSMIMLEYGRHIQIVEDWYAPGSIGNFTLQFSLDVANYTGTDFTPGGANELELVLITMNSGCMVCERGTSSIFQALLTKQMVLDASEKDVYTKSDVKRMVGGGFLDTLKSIASKVAPVAKVLAPAVLGDKGKVVSDVIGALGFGSGQSGGGSSGGRKLASRLM